MTEPGVCKKCNGTKFVMRNTWKKNGKFTRRKVRCDACKRENPYR